MPKQAEKVERIYQFMPCSVYDIASIEGWLEHMAQQGYLLQKFILSLAAVFVKGEPQKLRYRLTVMPERVLAASENEVFLALHEEFGWHYAAQCSYFGIFYTADEAAVELHTDPQIYAMALKWVKREQWYSLLLVVFQLLLYIPFQFIKHGSVRAMLNFGFCFWAGLLIFSLCITYWCLNRFLRSRKLYKQMRDTAFYGAQKDWHKGVARFQIKTAAFILLTACSFAWSLLGGYWAIKQDHAIALEDYTEPFPFVTMADFFPGSMFVQTDQSDYANDVKVKRDVLAPEQVSLSQRGKLYRNGSCIWEGTLWVDYYDTRFPWLARQLARELQQQDERLWGSRYQRYTSLELPALDIDYAVAYRTLFPTVILVDDCRLLYIMYQQSADLEQLSLEQLVQFYVEDLQTEGGNM